MVEASTITTCKRHLDRKGLVEYRPSTSGTTWHRWVGSKCLLLCCALTLEVKLPIRMFIFIYTCIMNVHHLAFQIILHLFLNEEFKSYLALLLLCLFLYSSNFRKAWMWNWSLNLKLLNIMYLPLKIWSVSSKANGLLMAFKILHCINLFWKPRQSLSVEMNWTCPLTHTRRSTTGRKLQMLEIWN